MEEGAVEYSDYSFHMNLSDMPSNLAGRSGCLELLNDSLIRKTIIHLIE
jgi:hypothetical protein